MNSRMFRFRNRTSVKQTQKAGRNWDAADRTGAFGIGIHCARLVDANDAPSLQGAWRELAAVCGNANPFFDYWSLEPALRYFGDERVRLACIFDGPDASRLIGLLPVQAATGYARLPIAYWRTWIYPHCFFGAPLIRPGMERAAIHALYGLLCEGRNARAFVRFEKLDAQSAFTKCALTIARHEKRECYTAGRIERACLTSHYADAAQFAQKAIRKKKRKELGRQERRLNDIGKVSFEVFLRGNDLNQWIADFLNLENKGWKGRAQSSLTSSAADKAWFVAAINGAAHSGQLKFLRLTCAGRPIAMLVNFGERDVFGFKICHDPEFAKYSPGVLIKVAASEYLLDSPGFSAADSCAQSEHPMINSLWRERRVLTGLNAASKNPLNGSFLTLCRSLEALKAMTNV